MTEGKQEISNFVENMNTEIKINNNMKDLLTGGKRNNNGGKKKGNKKKKGEGLSDIMKLTKKIDIVL